MQKSKIKTNDFFFEKKYLLLCSCSPCHTFAFNDKCQQLHVQFIQQRTCAAGAKRVAKQRCRKRSQLELAAESVDKLGDEQQLAGADVVRLDCVGAQQHPN